MSDDHFNFMHAIWIAPVVIVVIVAVFFMRACS